MIYPQQQTYQEARATYDHLYELSGIQQEMVLNLWSWDFDDDEELERYCQVATHLEFEIGLPQASQVYHEAEKALLQWGIAYCEAHREYSSVIGIVQQCLGTPFMHIRQKACDTLLKLR